MAGFLMVSTWHLDNVGFLGPTLLLSEARLDNSWARMLGGMERTFSIKSPLLQYGAHIIAMHQLHCQHKYIYHII